jgi:hypothetical protein
MRLAFAFACSLAATVTGCPEVVQVKGGQEDPPRMPERETDDGSGGSLEAEPSGGSDSAHEAGTEPAYDCHCRQDDDQCTEDQETCFRREFQCSAIAACPQGYECSYEGKCVCSSPEHCGIECDSPADCSSLHDCDTQNHVCRPALNCLWDVDCDDGKRCEPYWPYPYEESIQHLCVAPSGSEPLGAECVDSRDCASGVCEGICLDACRSNADCAEGLRCGIAEGGLGCMLPELAGCDTCSAPSSTCDGFGDCMQSCRTTAECSTKACVVDLATPALAFCADQGVACGPSEFRAFRYVSETLCFIDKGCWTNADCADPYECVHPSVTPYGPAESTGFCARQAD